MGGFLYLSNYSELLGQRLAQLLEERSNPFQKETVLIQNAGMERWLSLTIARQNGISAGIHFQFPANFLKQVLEVEPEERFPLDPDRFSWALQRAISLEIKHPDLKPLKKYLHQKSSIALFQLSRQIADIFDRYIVERPEWLEAWQQKRSIDMPDKSSRENQNWQANLWRRLVALYPDTDISATLAAWQRKFQQASSLAEHLPRRLFLFGITNLPPLHRQMLKVLSTKMEIHWFYPTFGPRLPTPTDDRSNNGSRSDNPSRAEADTLLKQKNPSHHSHPLLSTWQRSGGLLLQQIEQQFLQEGSGWQSLWIEAKTANQATEQTNQTTEQSHQTIGQTHQTTEQTHQTIGQTHQTTEQSRQQRERERQAADRLLYRLQSCATEQADPSASIHSIHSIQRQDDSLTLQSCHSELREVQELYNWLLQQFRRYRDLTAEDVLVLAPNIENYTPLIEAVFGHPEEKNLELPYSIADRPTASERDLMEDFFCILKLSDSRFSSSEVMAILELDSVRRRFAFSDRELEQITNWIGEAAIYWGRDEGHLERLGLPKQTLNTFRHGLERLLLSLALPAGQKLSFLGIAPVSEIEGDLAELLCRFVESIEILMAYMQQLEEEHTLKEWSKILNHLQQDLMATDELTLLLKELEDCFEQYGYSESVDILSVMEYLKLRIDKQHIGRGFLRGGITFSALFPMRCIPAKIVCLLGMQENNFPRREFRPQFDLFESSRRPGELDKAETEKLLFLEALFSARHIFYISHAGKSAHHPDQNISPAIQVEELCEYLDKNFSTESGLSPSQQLLTEHRLQPFHNSYFQGNGALFSFSPANCRAAVALLQKRELAKPFIQRFPALLSPIQQPTLELSELIHFFRHPLRHFIQRCLKTYIPKENSLIDKEPFTTDALLRFYMRQELVTGMLAAQERQVLDWLQASGNLLTGSLGQLVLEQSLRECFDFIEKLHSFLEREDLIREDLIEDLTTKNLTTKNLTTEGGISFAKEEMERRQIDLKLAAFRLTGSCSGLAGKHGELLLLRVGRIRPEDYLQAWLLHLALQLSWRSSATKPSTERAKQSGKQPPVVIFIGWEERLRFVPLEHGERYLQELAQIYRMGEMAALPIFPRSSFAFAKSWLEKGNMEKALQAAAAEWYPNPYRATASEASNAYNALCFRHRDPMEGNTIEGELFRELSLRIFKPLLEHALLEHAQTDKIEDTQIK